MHATRTIIVNAALFLFATGFTTQSTQHCTEKQHSWTVEEGRLCSMRLFLLKLRKYSWIITTSCACCSAVSTYSSALWLWRSCGERYANMHSSHTCRSSSQLAQQLKQTKSDKIWCPKLFMYKQGVRKYYLQTYHNTTDAYTSSLHTIGWPQMH